MTGGTRTDEVRASAMLRREPDNQYDRNAIGVYIHGAEVGHLDRYDAEDYQALLKRRGRRDMGSGRCDGRPHDARRRGRTDRREARRYPGADR
jgi:hypothetical protein